ncbi:hypothetical protein Zmor_020888 [Zophobas morio]|uniref:SAM domain-containing protein n=1 Tax=Zophobas morio TaxID=2755281 RepID=A0AA38I4D0_9CUCU|nr:hypothetical protein Zmor_020888 [Zophobas morio]
MTLSSHRLYLLVHTITITECDYVVQAQFFHTFTDFMGDVRLIGRRMRYRPRVRGSSHKMNLQRLRSPDLRAIMKRKTAKIRHHLRTIHLGAHNQASRKDGSVDGQLRPQSAAPSSTPPPVVERKIDDPNSISVEQLSSGASPEQTTAWLVRNRFDRYLETFANFSGADMLRMSRDDLIQICGQADGIRLYNAVHLKTIAPKLKIYVCRQNTSIFNAVFLSTHSNIELLEKLSALMGISQDQVHDIYIEGPHAIHVRLNNDVIRHIKEETMFSVEILQENGSFIFLLKRTVK